MASAPAPASTAARPRLGSYVAIARPDHWFKNVFMALGVLLAVFYRPGALAWREVPIWIVALMATCLIASSNYVLNELLDGHRDAAHPEKRHRPVPSGLIDTRLAVVEWVLLGGAGLTLAWQVGRPFAASAAALVVMGVLYNVPPVRLKEWPYLDVMSESINNPLRLLLGWFTLIPNRFPPVSLVVAYWMLGAFFMAVKRLAEYRYVADRSSLSRYRASFAYYTEPRLLVSVLFYAVNCALFGGIFIVRYHLELILFAPLGAAFLAYYLRIGLQPDSATQRPEHLYRQPWFIAFAGLCLAVFLVLMFIQVPALYRWFHVEASSVSPLWTIGSAK